MAETGTNSTAIKMIPKPDKVSTLFKPSQERDSLSFQMRLSGSPEKVNMYCEIVEKVAQLIDGYKPAVSGPHKRGQWQTFLKHVTKKCPILQKYEDAWPVYAILCRHRRNKPKRIGLTSWTRHKKPVQVKGTLSTPKPPAAELHLDRPDTDTKSEPPTSSGHAATEQSGLARPITRDLSAKTANISDETQVATRSIVPTAPLVRLASALTVMPQNAPVLAFLRTLVPDQSALLPLVISMGVTDDAALHGLARMQCRDEFVYSWVKQNFITELQFIAIITGLRGMVHIQPMSSTISA